jgi:molybdopterin-guanine dinucleotide biosynthesis protein A
VAGVLVGGKNSRLGIPKPLLEHPRGLTFVEYSVEVARTVARKVVLLGTREELPESLGGLPVLEDAEQDSGPLAGLCTLLECGSPGWVCLLACDLPLLTSAPLRRLLAEISDGVDAVAFYKDPVHQVYHTCCTLYHSRLLTVAQQELQEGKRLQSVLRQVRTVALEPSQLERALLTNINTRSDLKVLRESSPLPPL